MSGLEIVVLKQLFICEVAVLSLDGVELVTEGQVVLVSLLDLEDLSLQLGDEEVLLVTSEVHGIVILKDALKHDDNQLTLDILIL